MANSSDWIAALAELPPGDAPPQPHWFEALGEARGFVEGFPQSAPSRSEPSQPERPAPQPAPPPPPTSDPIAEAFAKGEAAGRAAAQTEHQAASKRQRALRLTFGQLDQAAMDALAQDLAQTVVSLCGKVLEDYTPDAAALEARCKDAAQRLGQAGGQAGDALALHLHPEDAAMLAEETRAQWKVTPDPAMERGGLRLETADGSINDGPQEWRRAIEAALKG